MMTKKEYRKFLREQANKLLTEELRLLWSRQIIRQIEADPHFRSARSIGLYMPLKDEPDLRPLMEKYGGEKAIYLPRVDSDTEINYYPYQLGDSLGEAGAFGLMEPRQSVDEAIAPNRLDLLVIPALTFDRSGYRLGRGKGYYDRYLPETLAYRIGVCYPLIAIESLHPDSWDQPMDIVYTAQRETLGLGDDASNTSTN